jgi:hypothetical protein
MNQTTVNPRKGIPIAILTAAIILPASLAFLAGFSLGIGNQEEKIAYTDRETTRLISNPDRDTFHIISASMVPQSNALTSHASVVDSITAGKIVDSLEYYRDNFLECRELFNLMSMCYEMLEVKKDSLASELAECAWAYSSLMEEYLEVLKTADPREYRRIMNWNDSMKELEKARTLR